MLKETLLEIYERDLLQLQKEIESYEDESQIWMVKDGISNSAGNLCLHLCGNLKHFIGATLGHTGYVRNRDAEFELKDIPRHALIADIESTIEAVNKSLTNLSELDFFKKFPLEKHGRVVTTDFMLLHLLGHLSYHIGQINYHRRLVSNKETGSWKLEPVHYESK
ncbi:MAG: DUF1572 family protein [Bacteroidia bacterium]